MKNYSFLMFFIFVSTCSYARYFSNYEPSKRSSIDNGGGHDYLVSKAIDETIISQISNRKSSLRTFSTYSSRGLKAPTLPGSIGSSQTICSGSDPVAFTSISPGVGDGAITYRWESSVSPFTVWSTISGEVSETFDAPAGLITTTQYRRIAISTFGTVITESDPSAPVTITLNDLPTLSGVVNNTTCGNTNGKITLTTNAASFLWSDGVTTRNRTGLVAGNYSVTVTSLSGCKATANFVVESSNIPGITVTAVNVNCFGTSTGSISASVSASVGAGFYTYSWTGPGSFTSTSANIDTLRAGTYDLIVTASNGCQAFYSTTIRQPAAPVSASIAKSDVLCFGSNDGALEVTASGGLIPYTYEWTGPNGFTSINQSITGLLAGVYTVKVIDANGCTFSTSSTIIEPAEALSASSVAGTILCNGGTTTVTITARGGAAPYTGIGTRIVSAGGYSFTVVDSKGCTTLVAGTVNEPGALLASATAGVISCKGGTTTVTISAIGGTAPYTGIGNQTVSAGPYSFTVRDANNCSTVVSGTITEPATLLASSVAGRISCKGETTTVTISATGGVAPYSGIGAQTVLAGPYSFTVTDSNGCSVVVSGTITEPSTLVASSVAGRISCKGDNTTVNVSATGGTAPYIGTGIQTVSAGPYSFTVRDANGCSVVVSGTITEPSTLIASSVAGSISCKGATTTVNVSATGGTAPYSGIGIQTVSAGPYSFTVTDANRCTSIVSGTITEPVDGLVASSVVGTILCKGGTTTITVSATGGVAPYTGTGARTVSAGPYSFPVTDSNGCTVLVAGTITEPSTLVASSVAGRISCKGDTTTVNVSATGGTAPYTGTGIQTVSAGPYSFTVRDANGCSVVVSGIITEPSELRASAIAGLISCKGGTTTVAIFATGGTAPYGGTGPQTVAAGPYSFTVTDALGCRVVVAGTITEPSELLASATSGLISCKGGTTTLTISATGGTAPYIGTGPKTVSAGPYDFTIIDANGCRVVVSGTITEPLELQASVTARQIFCKGGTTTVTISASGGTAPYSGAGIQTVSAGPYSFIVTDANGCRVVITGTISEPSELLASATAGSIACKGGTTIVTISAIGGTAPYGGTGPQTVAAGSYSFTVTDANGCRVLVAGTITEPSELIASAKAGLISCKGETTTVTISANGGTAPYSGTGIQIVGAGPYNFTVTDASGCRVVVAGVITEPSTLLASSVAGSISCKGGTTTVNIAATGGTAPYVGTGIKIVSAGSYSFTVTDATGCSVAVTGLITEPQALLASAKAGIISCKGESTIVTISASGGTAPYLGTGTFTVSAGPYSFSVTDGNGCTVFANGIVTEPTLPLLSTSVAGTIFCKGGTTTVNVSATGGTAPYTGIGIKTVSAGTYSFTVTDANGCTSLTTGTVIDAQVVILATSVSGTISCKGGTTTVNVSATGGAAPYTGTGIQTVSTGPYSFTVTDANGCSAVATGIVSEPSILVASSSDATISCKGGSTTVTISATGGTAPYTGTGIQTVSAGSYSFTITDANGCSAVATGTVTEPAVSIEVSNAVTPNNDGDNDYFHIGGLDCYSNNSLQIYNRWGALVFESTKYNNVDNVFDGSANSKSIVKQSDGLPDGTYYYIIKYVDFGGNVSQKAGYLYLSK